MDVGEGGGRPSALDNPRLETKHNIPEETRALYASVTTKSSKIDDSFRGGPSLDLEDVDVLDDDCLIEDSSLFPIIRFFSRVQNQIDQSMCNSLIVRLLGCSIGYNTLLVRIHAL
ncbi:hypothetical protein GQ457_04G015070 [Hibiscus cannabinus]